MNRDNPDDFEEFTVAAAMMGGALLAGLVIVLVAWVFFA